MSAKPLSSPDSSPPCDRAQDHRKLSLRPQPLQAPDVILATAGSLKSFETLLHTIQPLVRSVTIIDHSIDGREPAGNSSKACSRCWRLVLVDVRLLVTDSTWVQQLRDIFPDARLLALDPDTDVPMNLSQLLSAGIDGILSPDISEALFRKAICTLYRGEYWYPRGRMAEAIEYLKRLLGGCQGRCPVPAIQQSTDSQVLTPREQEVLTGLKRGLSNKQIARGLNVSPETVKVYVKRVSTKLGLRNRYQIQDVILA